MIIEYTTNSIMSMALASDDSCDVNKDDQREDEHAMRR